MVQKRYQDHRQKSFIAFKRMKDRIQRQAHLSEEKFAEHIEKLTQKIREGTVHQTKHITTIQ